VADEAIEGALERLDERHERPVIGAQELHHLLGLRRFGEGGEAAQVAEEGGDVAAMTFQNALVARGQDKLGERRREEALEARYALDLAELRRDALLDSPVPGGKLGRLRLQLLMGVEQSRTRGFEITLRRQQRRIRRLETPVEQRFLLLQQRHLISLLLHAPDGVALRGRIEQNHPHSVRIGIEMKIGDATTGKLERRHDLRPAGDRQQALEKPRLIESGLAEAQLAQAIGLEMAAGAHQNRIGAEPQPRRLAFAIGQGLEASPDALRQVHRAQPATRAARSAKASSTPSPVRALLGLTRQPARRSVSNSASPTAHSAARSRLFSSSEKGSGP